MRSIAHQSLILLQCNLNYEQILNTVTEVNSGTVSRILWHFTGGPKWDEKNKRQYSKLKLQSEAYDILQAIITSRKLKVSNYRELIKVKVPNVRMKNPETKKYETVKWVEKIIESAPICSLADIPIQHLSYHAIRYGKFAIGFHRKSVVKNNFNPVFYSLDDTRIVNSIYSGLYSSKLMNLSKMERYYEDLIDDIKSGKIYNAEKSYDDDLGVEMDFRKIDFDIELEELEYLRNEVEKSLKEFVSYVKTFDESEFNSIYCEREWRSVEAFNFNLNDIAMIVLPRRKK
ncbi:MAG: hypothetical protein KDC56_12470, partial [Flavobacteriaceae bacterium]|nr:hypothetical protein [Flavobacteriaceae bacterium]